MSGKRVCAWCKADLGEVPGTPNDFVTHGLCAWCKVKQLASMGIPVEPVVTYYQCGNHCTVTGQPAPERCKHGKEQVGA